MSRPSDEGRCDICGEPLQEAENMFRIHGSLGPCPKPPLQRPAAVNWQERAEKAEALLRELVTLKDMNKAIVRKYNDDYGSQRIDRAESAAADAMDAEYSKRIGPAWAAARAHLKGKP